MSIPALLAVFVVSVVLCRVFIRLGHAGILLDAPNARSLHVTPTVRAGGVAMAVAMLPALSILLPQADIQLHAIVIGWLLVFAVSLFDDFRDVSAPVRLSVHILAAFIVLLAPWFLGDVPSVSLWLIGPGLLWIVWATNLFNFMDGMDGLAGSMSLIGGAALSIAFFTSGAGALAFLLAAASAAAAGFLVYNRPPARIFMGDSGSASLGFLFSAVSAKGVLDNAIPAWLPILIFLPFVADATFTLIRRTWQRKRIWQAHREHAYQALVLAGIPVRHVLLAWSLAMICCGLAALVAMHLGKGGELLLIAAILLFSLVYWGIIRNTSS